ncbi:porin [Pseudoalteromonas denitrificans]|uniref:Outer membrane insertion C-terminal signal n=1 Tax=Pseudoalteromonas denitrificans DSM 6059 TaxID=1123010 RepID=A0A1I1F084_9GAMM|nr:porin [Pseudoalteromonas denitrificans]SFB90580.1 outer membrane insertion C-terminal signal [Pseudoalteromonas denitrificans DSM 6059]
MKIKLLFALIVAYSLPLQAEINISGFASVNGGKVLSGKGVFGNEATFLADYPIVSTYTEDFSMKPESLFGLQFTGDLTEGLTATAQVVARGANDYDAKFEWAYISYDLNENWTLQAGKKRLPLFYYSDFFDVGYAYVWMRAPADNYTWQIFNYNGINALYSGSIGDWSLSANLYGGREDDTHNKLLSDFFFKVPVREIWKDILGGVIQVNNDWLEIRATHMQYTNEREISGQPYDFGNGNMERDGKFYGLAVNADFGNLFILTELNKLDLGDDFDTYMVSVGYRFDNITPFISYADYEQDATDGENHNTTSFGIRWDFHSSAAFKIQYDDVEDDSVNLAVAGDSESITFGIDVVF